MPIVFHLISVANPQVNYLIYHTFQTTIYHSQNIVGKRGQSNHIEVIVIQGLRHGQLPFFHEHLQGCH